MKNFYQEMKNKLTMNAEDKDRQTAYLQAFFQSLLLEGNPFKISKTIRETKERLNVEELMAWYNRVSEAALDTEGMTDFERITDENFAKEEQRRIIKETLVDYLHNRVFKKDPHKLIYISRT